MSEHLFAVDIRPIGEGAAGSGIRFFPRSVESRTDLPYVPIPVAGAVECADGTVVSPRPARCGCLPGGEAFDLAQSMRR